MEKTAFYLDDYTLIKAYFYKPFDASAVNEIKILKNGKEIEYQIGIEFERNEYVKYKIILESEYEYNDDIVILYNNRSHHPRLRHIVSTKRFEDDFYPDVRTLGPFYKHGETTFRVWAPLSERVELRLIEFNQIMPMTYTEKGVYEINLKGSYDLISYRYIITRDGISKETVDPFAYSGGPNASCSTVLDPDKFIKKKIKPANEIKNNNDAIIYEISVRDFTSIVCSGTKTHGLFISLCEDDTAFEGLPTGLSYIKDLGVTHIQLMPVMDFGSVDEVKKDSYNWGYDPSQYNVTEGIYCSDVYDPYKRVNELREMVNKMHENDIRVNLDIVFNHVYHASEFSFEILLPYFAFRYADDETLSNGSFCGNEIRSENKLMHDYILLMSSRYLDIYDIDGLRFDLMGLTDIDTVNDVYKELKKKKADFMLYGEGWDMPSTLAYNKRSSLNNSLSLKNIGFFNPRFRDDVKGPTMGDSVYEPGYVLGNLGLTHEIKECLGAFVLNGYFSNPGQSVNYVECHDNTTFLDKMQLCIPNESYKNGKKRAKLALALILLAQGIPFIHSGQEFLRTKYRIDDTYNKGDYFNQMDYALRNQNIDVVNFTKDMIRIRKEYKEFRYHTKDEIIHNVFFEDYYEMLIYHAGKMVVFINPSVYEHKYKVNSRIRIVYNCDSFDKVIVKDELTIKPLSIVIGENIA